MSAAATQTVPQLARILLVDDHHILLEALSFVMASHYQIECLSSISQVDSAIQSFQPAVLIIDITMPDGDGIVTGQLARHRYPGIKLIFLSMYSEPSQVRRAQETGAHGLVSKRASADELLLAIDTVLRGGHYRSPDISATFQEGLHSVGPLTLRQKEVLRLVALGLSAKEIATALDISVRTAEFHRGAIMQRLNLHSTALLTRYAVDRGIV